MTVVVTGAANGLGRALAEACRDLGEMVIAVDRDADTLERIDGVRALVLDLLDPSAVGDLVTAVDGNCSAIYHSAGISGTGRFEDIPAEHHARILALNLEAPIQITCALLAAGACTGDARHVFIASASTYTGYPGATSYAASKDGLASFARSLDASLPDDMSAHCVFPGPLRTEHAKRYAPDNSDAVVKRRQDPAAAAASILRQVGRGRHRIFPTVTARGLAVVGTVLPGPTGRAVRASLYEKLETPRL